MQQGKRFPKGWMGRAELHPSRRRQLWAGRGGSCWGVHPTCPRECPSHELLAAALPEPDASPRPPWASNNNPGAGWALLLLDAGVGPERSARKAIS